MVCVIPLNRAELLPNLQKSSSPASCSTSCPVAGRQIDRHLARYKLDDAVTLNDLSMQRGQPQTEFDGDAGEAEVGQDDGMPDGHWLYVQEKSKGVRVGDTHVKIARGRLSCQSGSLH